MPQRHRHHVARGHAALFHVADVAAADAAGGHAHQDVVLASLGFGHLVQAQVARSVDHRLFHCCCSVLVRFS